jgi:hypothetical protein
MGGYFIIAHELKHVLYRFFFWKLNTVKVEGEVKKLNECNSLTNLAISSTATDSANESRAGPPYSSDTLIPIKPSCPSFLIWKKE